MSCSGQISIHLITIPLWISGLSKESNKNLPILGSCVKGLQNIYLPDHRQIVKSEKDGGQTKVQRREDSVSSLISQRVKDKRFPIICLAPEGTCGDGHCILKFRTGAFVSGAPVLPILLKYSNKNLNPAWTNMNEGVHFVSQLILAKFVLFFIRFDFFVNSIIEWMSLTWSLIIHLKKSNPMLCFMLKMYAN